MSESRRRPGATRDVALTMVLLAAPWVLATIVAWSIAWLPIRSPAATAGILLAVIFMVLLYEQQFGKLTNRIVEDDRALTHDRVPDQPNESEDISLLSQYAPTEEQANRRFRAALARVKEAGHRITVDHLETTRVALRTHLNYVQGRIDKEYEGIAARTGWLLAGQAFLLTVFATILSTTTLPPTERKWFATGIAIAGATISGVLSVATYLGHALASRLKIPRDALEDKLARLEDLPRSGVPTHHVTYALGHHATRYLPTFAYVAWISLVVAVFNDGFGLVEETTPGIGWIRYPEPSPAFPIGRHHYVVESQTAGPSVCPDNTEAARAWAARVVRAWRARRTPSDQDTLILIGGVDRLSESKQLRDTALAEARARTVQELLIELAGINARGPLDTISERQIQRHVTGARHPYAPRVPDCTQPDLAVDRTVEVWFPD